jgi:uncharacterized protein YjiS (DUF1127 family)
MFTKTPGSGAPPRGGSFPPLALVRKAFAAVREGLELARRYRMLANMSDERLAALGVSRKDIARIAVNGWKR